MRAFRICRPGEESYFFEDLTIRFTPYDELNDVYESMPIIRNIDISKPPEQDLLDLIKRMNPGFSVYRTRKAALNHQRLLASDSRYLDQFKSMLFKDVGALCLTADVTDARRSQLWSHYGSSHKGFAIEFNLASAPFVEPNKYGSSLSPCSVDYSSQRPEIEMARIAGRDRQFLYTKSDAWANEAEIRVLCNLEEFGLAPSGIMKISPKSINSVVIGLRTEEPLRQKLKNLPLDPKFQHLEVFELTANKDDFGFSLRSIPRQ